VSPDEAPYLLDLHLFLGRPLKLADPSETSRLGKTILLKINFTDENCGIIMDMKLSVI